MHEEKRGDMARREDDREEHARLWETIDGLVTRLGHIEIKAHSIETLMERQNAFCAGELSRWEDITKRMGAHETKVLERITSIEKILADLSGRMTFIETAPMRVILGVGATMAVLGGVWVFVREWLKRELTK